MSKKCCGFGHRKLQENKEEIIDKLYGVICYLISKEGVVEFMIGEMGDFDWCFSSAVRRAKKIYPQIKLVLVQPYFSSKLNTNKEYYQTFYDDMIVPIELIGCHYKSAITKRNQWMVEKSKYIISYVRKDHGGAFDAVSYAHECGKSIISI